MSRPRERKAAEGRRPLQSIHRDQGASDFTSILERVVAETRSARAAALFDYEGETVDYAGDFDTFELKVSAAHWQILFSQLGEEDQMRHFTDVRQVIVRARKRPEQERPCDRAHSIPSRPTTGRDAARRRRASGFDREPIRKPGRQDRGRAPQPAESKTGFRMGS